MPEKVLILEIKENYALAMGTDGAILRIRRKEKMAVGDSVYILPEDIYQETEGTGVLPLVPKKKMTNKGVRHLAAIAASLALLLTLLIPQFSMKAYAVVSLDAEHGMQMQVDRNNQILSVVSPDGSIPQETLDSLKGKDLLQSGTELTQILGKGPILVGYASHDGEKNKKSEAEIRALFANQELIYLPGTSKDIQQADASSQSLGKYILGMLLSEEHADWLEEFYEAYYAEDDDTEEETPYHEEYWETFAKMDLDTLLASAQANPDYMKNETFRDILSDKLEDAADALEDAAEEIASTDDPDEDDPDDLDDADDYEDDDLDDNDLDEDDEGDEDTD